jgi:hypothetical protein
VNFNRTSYETKSPSSNQSSSPDTQLVLFDVTIELLHILGWNILGIRDSERTYHVSHLLKNQIIHFMKSRCFSTTSTVYFYNRNGRVAQQHQMRKRIYLMDYMIQACKGRPHAFNSLFLYPPVALPATSVSSTATLNSGRLKVKAPPAPAVNSLLVVLTMLTPVNGSL